MNNKIIWLLGIIIFCTIPVVLVSIAAILAYLEVWCWYWFLAAGVLVALGLRIHYEDFDEEENEEYSEKSA